MNYKSPAGLLILPLPEILTKKVMERVLLKERAQMNRNDMEKENIKKKLINISET